MSLPSRDRFTGAKQELEQWLVRHARDGVYQVYYTMGDVDFVVILRTQDRNQMYNLIDEIIAIDGVNETSSHFVMKELQREDQVVNNMSDEMVENVLGD